MTSHLRPTNRLLDLIGRIRIEDLATEDHDEIQDFTFDIREARIDRLESLALGVGDNGSNKGVWEQTLDFLRPHTNRGNIYGEPNVVWIIPDVVFLMYCGDDEFRESRFEMTMGEIGFGKVWRVTPDFLVNQDPDFCFEIYARTHPHQASRDEQDKKQAMDAILRSLASDATMVSVYLDRWLEYGAPLPLPLSTESVRSLVGARAASLRTIVFGFDYDDNRVGAPSDPIYSKEEMRTMLTHCRSDIHLCIDIDFFDRSRVELFPAGQGPRRMVLREGARRAEPFRFSGHFLRSVVAEYHTGARPPQKASYTDVLRAMHATKTVQALSIDVGFTKTDVCVLMTSLPRGLVTLRLPTIYYPLSAPEWETLCKAVSAQPDLRSVTFPEQRGNRVALERRKLRATIMASCLRASSTLTEVIRAPAPGPWSIDETAFKSDVEPILYANRHRPKIEAIPSEPNAQVRQALFVSALLDARFRPLSTLMYPLLRRNLDMWLPLE